MALLSEELQLTAPAPGAVLGTSAQIVGSPGSQTFFYWWVSHYPIGVTVLSAPILVRRAPDSLSATNFVIVTGQPSMGATAYDLLRTNSPNLPSGTAVIAVATGLTVPTFNDQGAALTAYSVAGLASGAPVSESIYLNNRDHAMPVLEFSPWPVGVPGIFFPDGSFQNTAGGGGGGGIVAGAGIALTGTSPTTISVAPACFIQSPWLCDIQASQHNLLGLACLRWDAPVGAFPAKPVFACVDDFDSLQLSWSTSDSSNGLFWFTQLGQLGIGPGSQLPTNSVALFITHNPAASSQKASIGLESDANSVQIGVEATAVGAPFAGSFFEQDSTGYNFLITPQSDVALGLSNPNVGDYTGRVSRLFITDPPTYVNTANPMIYTFNKTQASNVIFETGINITSTITLIGGNQTHSIVSNGGGGPNPFSLVINDLTTGPIGLRLILDGFGNFGIGAVAAPPRESRLFITTPTGYPHPSDPMLWAFNPQLDSMVLFECGQPTLTSSLALRTTGTSSYKLVTNGNGGSFPFCFVIIDEVNGTPPGVRFVLTGTGDFGLGGIIPTHLLELATDSAAKPTTNTWTITSDIRTKRHVRPLKGGMSVIAALEPIESEYNGLANTPEGSRVVSFDPDKLASILPSAVTIHRGKLHPEDPIETDIKGVNTHEVIHHLVLAVQQLAAQIKGS